MSKTYIVKEKNGCGCGTLLGLAIIISIIYSMLPFIAIFLAIAAIAWGIWYFYVKKPQLNLQKAKDQEEAEIAEMERQNELKKRKILAMKESQNIDGLHSELTEKDNSDWNEF